MNEWFNHEKDNHRSWEIYSNLVVFSLQFPAWIEIDYFWLRQNFRFSDSKNVLIIICEKFNYRDENDCHGLAFQIARDSRRLAEEHEAAAAAVIGLADSALNSSREALRLLTDTIAQKNNNTAVLDELRREQSLLQSLQTRVQNLATMAKEDADKAYNEALEIYTQASGLAVPKIDVPALMIQASDIDTGSQQIANSSTNLLSGKKFINNQCWFIIIQLFIHSLYFFTCLPIRLIWSDLIFSIYLCIHYSYIYLLVPYSAKPDVTISLYMVATQCFFLQVTRNCWTQ